MKVTNLQPYINSLFDIISTEEGINLITSVSDLLNDSAHSSKVIIVNSTDEEGNTPLHKACEKGDLELVKLLINSGANPLLQNEDGETVLHIACKEEAENNYEIVKFIINSLNRNDIKQLINITTAADETALYHAIWLKGEESNKIVKLLLEEGADPNIGNDFTNPLFGCLVRKPFYRDSENLENIRLLIEHGANYLRNDKVVGNAFFRAAAEGYVEAAQIIFEKAKQDHNIGQLVTPAIKSVYPGMSVIEVATDKGNKECAEKFVEWYKDKYSEVTKLIGAENEYLYDNY
jgi:ankyrin repeat protein